MGRLSETLGGVDITFLRLHFEGGATLDAASTAGFVMALFSTPQHPAPAVPLPSLISPSLRSSTTPMLCYTPVEHIFCLG